VLEKNKKRPRTVANCSRTDDHPAHDWTIKGAKHAGWRCRGLDHIEGAIGVRLTKKAIAKAYKADKPGRAQWRKLKNFPI
jgi:hypothetical protein